MNLRKTKATFSILVGGSIISLWIMLFISGQIPELDTEPFSILLHIFSELLLAMTLIIAGVGLLRQSRISEKTFLLAMGLLSYSVINAAGYHGERENWAVVIMFAAIGFISAAFVAISLRKQD